MNEKIYVVGHKNPDTDSICSAIAYSNLKNILGFNTIPCRLGPLNEETKFVLNRFNLDNPLLLKDARSELSDIDMDIPKIVDEDCTLKEAWEHLFLMKNKSVCVVDENNKLSGIMSTSNLIIPRLMVDEDIENLMKETPLELIAKTINGVIKIDANNYETNGKIFIITLSDDKITQNFKDAICILSNGEEKQLQLIKNGAKCLIITCDQPVSNEVYNYALKMDCAIIESVDDTMKVAKTINECFSVKKLMTKNLVTFKNYEFVSDVSKKMSNTRFRSYPVLDEEGNVVGAISRYHLQNYRRRKFILVDHSAIHQAITNIMDAEIEEIVDHHHIGNIETSYPIYYRNQKCGCTCTIIAKMYEENNIVPNVEMAGIMMSAIISDTLHFKSKTTTIMDIEACVSLAKIADVDIAPYAIAMLSASVALKDSTMTQILNRDLKVYDIGKFKIGIGQTNYHDIEDIQAILPIFRENMRSERRSKEFDLMIMMFTNVMAKGSMFVFSGSLSYIMEDIMQTSFDSKSGFDPDIISRKQQLMPKLSSILKMM